MAIGLIFLAASILGKNSPKGSTVVIASTFGFTGLLSLLFILALPLLNKWFGSGFIKKLLANRRWLGIFTFVIICIHVFAAFSYISSLPTLKQPNALFVGFGVGAFIIVLMMAATSNNEAVSALGKNWKKLHNYIYLAVPLVLIHSSLVGLLVMKQPVVRISVILLAVLIIVAKKGIYAR